MPVVYAHYDDKRTSRRGLLQLLVPTRTALDAPDVSRWTWPELRAGVSAIQGFGLYTRASDHLDWSKVQRPVAVPYLGKETEVESASTSGAAAAALLVKMAARHCQGRARMRQVAAT